MINIMSKAVSETPQLRSRKSKMVPRVNDPHIEMSTHGEAVEMNRLNSLLLSGAAQNLTKTLIVPGVSESRDLTDANNVLSDPLSLTPPSCNGETVETRLLENTGECSGEEECEADDGDHVPLLLEGRMNDRGRSEDVEVENEFEDAVRVWEVSEENETSLSILLQILLPYLIAGFGMVGAGMVLDVVQHSPVFTNISELFILVPALLGLKGNLEMTLASRLSTQANLGNMDNRHEKLMMIGGNLALIQAQATVVGFLASLFAMVMGWIPQGEFPLDHALLLCASSLFTASIASFILGSLMAGVVLLSRKIKINPDNVATPIAASLGDLITLTLLAEASSLLYSALGNHRWLSPMVVGIFILLLPLWVTIAVKNRYTNEVIYSGWTPVLSAMVISSLGGVILTAVVTSHRGIAVFQPVINGVGGNLVAVQASRISTYLHRRGRPGEIIPGMPIGCSNPCTFFCGKMINSRAARVLLLLVVPGHLIFIYTIYYMKAGHTSITLLFNVFYLLAALLQVSVLLFISQWLVHRIWQKGDDPDNEAIPYLTAIGDLLGTGLLALAFQTLYLIGDGDADLGD